jgi:hypothetical protein
MMLKLEQNNLTRNQMLQNTFDLFAQQMDARHALYEKLEEFHIKHGYIPPEHVAAWLVWTEQDKRTHWRKVPGCVARLWNAARIEVRNGYANAKAALDAAHTKSNTK